MVEEKIGIIDNFSDNTTSYLADELNHLGNQTLALMDIYSGIKSLLVYNKINYYEYPTGYTESHRDIFF